MRVFHIASQGQTVPWNRWSKCFIVKDSIRTVVWVTWGSVEAARRKQSGRTLRFQLGANWRLWQPDKIMKFSVFYLMDFMSQVWNKVLCSPYTSLCFLLWMHFNLLSQQPFHFYYLSLFFTFIWRSPSLRFSKKPGNNFTWLCSFSVAGLLKLSTLLTLTLLIRYF